MNKVFTELISLVKSYFKASNAEYNVQVVANPFSLDKIYEICKLINIKQWHSLKTVINTVYFQFHF